MEDTNEREGGKVKGVEAAMSRASTLPLITFSYEPFFPLFSPAVLRPFFPEPTQLPWFPFPVNVCPLSSVSLSPTLLALTPARHSARFSRPLEKRFNTFLPLVVAREGNTRCGEETGGTETTERGWEGWEKGISAFS